MSRIISFSPKQFPKFQENIAYGLPPRKLILLLAVIDLFEHGLLSKNQIFLSAELMAAFLKYWNKIEFISYSTNIAATFLDMRSENFWHLKIKHDLDSVKFSGLNFITISSLKNFLDYAYLDKDIFVSLKDKSYRLRLFKFIVKLCFPKNQHKICELLKFNTFTELQKSLKNKGGVVYNPQDLDNEEKIFVRESAFSRVVSSVYHYQCAFCGLRAINSLSQTLVDGTHIKPFSLFYDDRIDNGISLCKNHRWAFEQGWFTVDDDYKIIISNDLWVESLYVKSLREFQGKRILLPPHNQYFPRIEALRWHRENIFNRFACSN